MDRYDQNPDTLGLLGLALVAGFILLNVATFTAFAVDKRRAMAGEFRLPELSLLTLAALGGWPAAKLAQLFLGHSVNETFRTLLNMVALPLIALLALVAYLTVDFPALWVVIDETLKAQISSSEPEEGGAPAVPKKAGSGASAKIAGAWKSK